MAKADVVAFNIAAFTSALFLLEFGADKFIDHTAVIARRTGISETIIGLITAGCEWEELAVVIFSIARGRKSLAIGNIIGSSISNILGAFSLGLLFQKDAVCFDQSSKIYSGLLLVLTTFAVPVTYFNEGSTWLICGSILLTLFAAYLGSVGWALSRGALTAPEGSDCESSDDESSSSSNSSSRRNSSDALLPRTSEEVHLPTLQTAGKRTRSLGYHTFQLIYGLLAICLAGYILAHSATNITDEFNISDILFGVVILAFATTLPEKFVAVMSGQRHRMGILVANTAGSNIFLLTLCLGIVMVSAAGKLDDSNVTIVELSILWASTLALTLTIWVGAKMVRWIGAAMILAYIAFIVVEVAVVHG